ncbi:hypothetical protein B9Z55_016925 [Caenorhabditis nigoni]|uniref:Uncharacterized protein n=1 Tax=Caenorhabditis nigoni TaxID=1611254 RepID=A0A2G5T7G4_9PELO|nr:hypothetical protein B9Z55_016925 [Caenorhabditis nigoni]
MRRADYDQVPNRIIPPQGSALDPRYERSARILPAPTIRQPLLGNAPPQVASYANGYESAYNNYNTDPSRRRGFDKGPAGEDLRRVDGQRPLMRHHPRLAVEHVGGDMDISRSRSPSPEVQIIKSISARSVRDDRKKYRGDSSRRRSRSRSRSPSRGDRDHRRAPKPLRMDRDDYDREKVNSRYEDSPPQIRDGVVHTSENYFDFLIYYVDTLHDQLQVNRGSAPVVRRTNMTITEASPLEKKTIVLPPIFDDSDRERMLHCDTTIAGLPTSIFYGSGYGPRVHYAKYSAAKDLIDKCHRIGVLSSVLYAAIGDFERVDNDFKVRFANHISKAVNAVLLLIQRMNTEELPTGFMTMRHLPNELIARFKTMLRMVMMEVYYHGNDPSEVAVPKSLETGYSRSRDSPKAPKGPSAEEILRQKEKELEDKMKMELAKKRQEMEAELREKILKEERDKIRAEMEREKNQELMKIQQKQYEMEKERKEIEEKQRKSAVLKQVEEDFNSMVERFANRFEEVRAKGVQPVLTMIYNSATYKTIQLYSTTLTSLSSEQKQQLAQDLRSLLDSISVAMSMHSVAMPQPIMPQPGLIQPGLQPGLQQPMMGNPMMGGLGNPMIPNYQPQPMMGGYQVPQQQMPEVRIPQLSTSSNGSRKDEVRRLTLGNMQLRQLSSSEQRRLTKGDKVIAQDSKTGTWALGTVERIRDNRATLAVNGATWKKYLDELYKEDEGRSMY